MCHVLVIEDDGLIAEYIITLIAEAGATSIDQAFTEDEAVELGLRRTPALIVSDVKLAEGTGPVAVQRIIAEIGAVPVMFVTGTPEACQPCEPPMVILGKPIVERELVATFRSLAPL